MRAIHLPEHQAWIRFFDLGGDARGPRVFLGGLGSASSAVFPEVAAHSSCSGRRALLIDLLGSGWSDPAPSFSHTIEAHAESVAFILDQLRVHGCTIVGHSFGGSVAIALASQRPDLLRDLIVAEPNLDPGVGTVSKAIAAHSEQRFVAQGHRELIELVRRSAETGDANAINYRATLERWSAVALHRSATSMLADRTPTFRQQLTSLSMRRTMLVGARSNEDLRDLAESGVEIRVVPNAGHVMMEDNLDGFAEALKTG